MEERSGRAGGMGRGRGRDGAGRGGKGSTVAAGAGAVVCAAMDSIWDRVTMGQSDLDGAPGAAVRRAV